MLGQLKDVFSKGNVKTVGLTVAGGGVAGLAYTIARDNVVWLKAGGKTEQMLKKVGLAALLALGASAAEKYAPEMACGAQGAMGLVIAEALISGFDIRALKMSLAGAGSRSLAGSRVTRASQNQLNGSSSFRARRTSAISGSSIHAVHAAA